MDYPCVKLVLAKQMLGPNGIIEPLCNSCTQIDCTNPIRKKTVSILGVNKEWHLFMEGTKAYQIVGCEGYINE